MPEKDAEFFKKIMLPATGALKDVDTSRETRALENLNIARNSIDYLDYNYGNKTIYRSSIRIIRGKYHIDLRKWTRVSIVNPCIEVPTKKGICLPLDAWINIIPYIQNLTSIIQNEKSL